MRSHSVVSNSLWSHGLYTVHGILQARILGWVAFPFYRGCSQPRDQTQVSRIAGRFFNNWATTEALRGEGGRRIKSQILLSLWFCISKKQEASLTSLIAILKVSTWTQLSRTDYSGTLLASLRLFKSVFPKAMSTSCTKWRSDHILHKPKTPLLPHLQQLWFPNFGGFTGLKLAYFTKKLKKQSKNTGTSLVVQWLRICFPIRGGGLDP